MRWKGYSPVEDSWVSTADLHTPELLAQFQNNPDKTPLQPSKKRNNATHSIRTLRFEMTNDITQSMTTSPSNYASPTIAVSELPDFSDTGNSPLCPGTPYPWVFDLESSQEGPPGPSNHLYHTDSIWDTWELAQATTTWFNQNPDNFPPVTLLGTLRPDVGGGSSSGCLLTLLVVDYCNLTTPTRVLVSTPMYLVPVLCYISSTEGHLSLPRNVGPEDGFLRATPYLIIRRSDGS